jgi:hypothetical protein
VTTTETERDYGAAAADTNPAVVTLTTTEGPRDVPAEIVGVWALHVDLDCQDKWCVTHVPSGLKCLEGAEARSRRIWAALTAHEPQWWHEADGKPDTACVQQIIWRVDWALDLEERNSPDPLTAIQYFLARAQRDHALGFHLAHTEAWTRFVRVEAVLLGRPLDDVLLEREIHVPQSEEEEDAAR